MSGAQTQNTRVPTMLVSPLVRQGFVDRQPMGRLGRPDEVAALAVYLASDESAFTTGHVHLVDGGWAM